MIDKALLAEKNLWRRLADTPLPIVMYGMGNGADKILDVLSEKGIAVSDFFASDGFVRGHSFHEKRVLTLAEIEEKYERFQNLLSFGSSLEPVMTEICRLSERHALLAPDVPICGGELFDADFYLSHAPECERTRMLLADEKSQAVFDDVISYKLSGDISYLRRADTPKHEAMTSLLSGGYTAYADLGAYKGDTITETLAYFPSVRKIVAFEPSPKIFAKLEGCLSRLNSVETTAFPLCAWNLHEIKSLTDGAGRNTSLCNFSDAAKTKSGAKIHECECDTLDARVSFSGEKLLIKYDVEGAEKEALLGSLRTMQSNSTELIVSLYHKSRDLFELPPLIHELLPKHRLYLRKHPYIPAWDVNLYVCSPK